MSLGIAHVPKYGISSIEKLSQKIQTQEDNNNKTNPLVSLLENETLKLCQTGQGSKNDMHQTLALFRKYLHDKAHLAMKNASAQECEATGSQPKTHRSLLPLQRNDSLPRRPTLLEQRLLPVARGSSILPSNNSSSKAQLTIFYSGAINVYDNVPADKAQAIMLLATESSLSNPASPTTPTSSTPPKCSSLLPFPNTRADLPIARKLSLRHFLEKRRDRIASRSPYASSTIKSDIDGATTNDRLTEKQTFSSKILSLHLDCFNHVSTNNTAE